MIIYLENIHRSRLTEAIVPSGISPPATRLQNGKLRERRITTTGVLLVTLDVPNALNSVRWTDMLWELEHTSTYQRTFVEWSIRT